MDWTKETGLLQKALINNQEACSKLFFDEGKGSESFFCAYENGRHISDLMPYEVSDMISLEKGLNKLWGGRKDMDYSGIKNVLLLCYQSSEPKTERTLSKVELHNYTL